MTNRRHVALRRRTGRGAILWGGGSGGGNEWDALLATALHWYRADTVTLSGANLASMPNRGTGGGAMTVTVGTLAAPTSDAQLGGAPSIKFNRSQQLQSNLTLADWVYLHGGLGEHTYFVGVTQEMSGTQLLWATRTGGGGDRGSSIYAPSDGSYNYNNTEAPFQGSVPPGSTAPGRAFVFETSYVADQYPRVILSYNASAAVIAAPSVTVSSALPSGPLSFGQGVGSLLSTSTTLGEFISFNRRLLPYERQLIMDYVRTRYGISLPTMTGVDREVLKLNPYSWIRADKYVENAGKLSAFPDLVLPGHSMAQATVANQVNVPAADAWFNGQLVASFSGAQTYGSNFPIATWRFLHNRTGSTSSYITRATDTAGVTILSTSHPLAGLDVGTAFYNGNGSATYSITSGTSADGLGGLVTPVTPSLISTSDTGSVLSYYEGGALVSSSASGLVGANTDSFHNLYLGGRNDGAVGWKGQIAEALRFTRALSTGDVAVINAYSQTKYGTP